MQSVYFVVCAILVFGIGVEATDRLCYEGTLFHATTAYCAGSCLTMETTRNTYVSFFCSPIYKTTGCSTVSGVKACYCNLDYCNNKVVGGRHSNFLSILGDHLPAQNEAD